MAKRYPVVVHKDPDSDWGLSFVDLPIHIMGKDLEKALTECQEAFEEFMVDEEVLPDPSALEKVMDDEKGGEAYAVLLAEIDTAFFVDPSERRSMSAKLSQWEAIDRAAKKAGQTRSAFMVTASLEKSAELTKSAA